MELTNLEEFPVGMTGRAVKLWFFFLSFSFISCLSSFLEHKVVYAGFPGGFPSRHWLYLDLLSFSMVAISGTFKLNSGPDLWELSKELNVITPKYALLVSWWHWKSHDKSAHTQARAHFRLSLFHSGDGSKDTPTPALYLFSASWALVKGLQGKSESNLDCVLQPVCGKNLSVLLGYLISCRCSSGCFYVSTCHVCLCIFLFCGLRK